LCVGFLIALLQPTIPTPFQLAPAAAWIAICYAFAASLLLILAAHRHRWRLTPFDYLLFVYVAVVLVTWGTSVNRSATGDALVTLLAQVAVFYAVRLLVEMRRTLGLVIVAAMIIGIAVLEWLATDYHVRFGLSARLLDYPALEWNGREGLGIIGAIQFGLLVGAWQDARSRTMQAAAVLLAAVSIVEVLFFYSRLPYVVVAAVIVAAVAALIRLRAFRRAVVALAVVAAVVATSSTPYVVHLVRRAAGLEAGAEAGPELRLELLSNAATIIRRHWVLGVGLGNFPAVHRQLFPIPYKWSGVEMSGAGHPHNAFVQQIAEVGVVGGAAYAALWATALWAGWQITTRGAPAIAGASSVFYAIVAIAVANLGENMFLDTVAVDRIRIHTIAWVLLAAVIAEWTRVRAATGEMEDAA
jgi:hypothetical protein